MRHSSPVTNCIASKNGHLLLTTDGSNAYLWETISGTMWGGPYHHGAEITNAYLVDDEQILICGGPKCTIWKQDSAKPIKTIPYLANIIDADIDAKRDWIAILYEDGITNIHRTSDGELFSSMKSNSCYDVALSNDGRKVAICHKDLVSIHDVDGTEHLQLSTGRVQHINFDPLDNRIVTCSSDVARVWDAQTGELTSELNHNSELLYAAFSPDSKSIATGSADGVGRIWRTLTFEPITPPLTHPGPVTHLQFSSDGKLIATSDGLALEPITDLSIWEELRTLGSNEIGGVARVWCAQNGQPLTPWLRHSKHVSSAFFTNDNSHLVTSSDDKTVKTWTLVPTKSDVFALTRTAELQSRRQLHATAGMIRTESNQNHSQKLSKPIGLIREQTIDQWHEAESAEHEWSKDWFAATWHLTKLLDRNPQSIELLLRRSIAYQMSSKYSAAIADLNAIISLKPESAELYQKRARLHGNLGDWMQATNDLVMAVEFDNENESTIDKLWITRNFLPALANVHKSAESATQRIEAIEKNRKRVNISMMAPRHAIAIEFDPTGEFRVHRNNAKAKRDWQFTISKSNRLLTYLFTEEDIFNAVANLPRDPNAGLASLLQMLLANNEKKSEITVVQTGMRYGVFIGVEKIPGFADLQASRNDVVGLSSALKRHGLIDESIVLLDSKATLDGIRQLFDDELTALLPIDELLFYYSGRGGRKQGLIPYDFDIREDGIDVKTIREWILSVSAQKLSVVLDCAYSGTFADPRVWLGPQMNGRDIRVLAACRGDQESFEFAFELRRGGVLTKHLTDFVSDKRQSFRWSEAYEHLRLVVPVFAMTRDLEQEPTYLEIDSLGQVVQAPLVSPATRRLRNQFK